MDLQEGLTQEDINKYKAQGFTEEEISQAMSELQQEASQNSQQSALQQSYIKAMQLQQQDPRQFASNTLISGNIPNQNLIQWQLELDSILERIEHMLRGDKPRFVNGSMIFTPAETNEDKIFTDFGVQEIMRILSMYLNRNTILSNYDEPTIDWKVFDFGNELADLIYLKYEVMFATMTYEECFKKIKGKTYQDFIEFFGYEKEKLTESEHERILESLKEQDRVVLREMKKQCLEKRKLYPMIVRELVDCVHSAYLRAYNGGERQSLHEARTISQSETIMPQGFGMGGVPMRERSMLNPLRWLGKKYK